ncbi:MAG: DUF362 domain-containing protein [Candidatus Omnitrophota bacterium]
MKRVVILKIGTYDFKVLKDRIGASIDKYFLPAKLFSPADKVLLKPNLLMPASPEEAIVTHPVFVEAVGCILKEMGCTVAIGDSPGGLVDNPDMDVIYETTQLKRVAEERGFELLYPKESVVRQGLPLCRWVDDFKMVNLPKLKTHDIMMLTLAVKNLYGCISGLHKSYLHRMYPKADYFTEILIQLYKMIRPTLHVVDGILALQGHGPAKGGKPRALGLVAIGDDALATDYAIAKLLGLQEDNNPLMKKAKQYGLISGDNIEIISEIGDHEIKNFKFPAPFILNAIPDPLLVPLKAFFSFRPAVSEKKCTGCGFCKTVCPQGAIDLQKGKACIDYTKCIMCMCCSEMCRFGAVNVAEGMLLKVVKTIRQCFR